MFINLASVFTAILLSSIFISIVCMLRRNNKFINILSVKTITFILILSVVRVFFPIEFKNSILIKVPILLTTVFRILKYSISISILSFRLKVYEILIIVWILGILYNAFKLIKTNNLLIKYLKTIEGIYGHYKNDYIENNFGFLDIRVVKSKKISNPFSIGLFGYKRVFLPDLDFSDEQLKYVLLHESSHIKSLDTYRKIAIQIINVIFWWNPLFKTFSSNFSHLLEMQADLNATKNFSSSERDSYVRTINDLIKEVKLLEEPCTDRHFLLTGMCCVKDISQRYNNILDFNINKYNAKWIMLMTSIVLVYILSFFVVIQPYYSAPDMVLYEDNVENEKDFILKDNTSREYMVFINNRLYDKFKFGNNKIKNIEYQDLNIYEKETGEN